LAACPLHSNRQSDHSLPGAQIVRRHDGQQAGKAIRLEHRYSVGQIVELTPSPLRAAATGEYEIRQTMPLPDISSASPRYRIKSIAEKHDRIVTESELILPRSDSIRIPAAHEDMQLPRVDN
jgi:hypothetical protein